ncbi:MAG: helix-turn-helix domain-containing protein [Sulfuritalea sp.]|nr:helix-turn-helix domain-containing protein [Sulfuritalea sp.]
MSVLIVISPDTSAGFCRAHAGRELAVFGSLARGEGRLTHAEAAQILGMCERSFRRYLSRYEAEGLEDLIDRRLAQVGTAASTTSKGGCA